MSEHDDDMRDPHLREALRHAPDAQLEAPAALGDFILKEARAKARNPNPAASPSAAGWARSLWEWLARPAVATGFAGVMAATLVGLMWWDRPMDEAMPRAPVPTSVPAQPSAAKPEPAPTPAPSATTPLPATRREAPVEARPATKPDGTAQRAKPAKVGEPAPQQRKQASAADVPAKPSAMEERRLDERLPASPPPARALPAPAAAPQPELAQGGAREGVANATTQGELARPRAAATESLAPVRRALDAEPTRWTWQRGDAPPQALTDPLQAWLARLDAAAGDRWKPAEGTAPREGLVLRLLRDGRVAHDLRIVDGAAWWQHPDGRWRFVALPTSSVRALESNAP